MKRVAKRSIGVVQANYDSRDFQNLVSMVYSSALFCPRYIVLRGFEEAETKKDRSCRYVFAILGFSYMKWKISLKTYKGALKGE